MREAMLTARLDHPNVVPVHDFGLLSTQGGGRKLFLCMKRIRGRTLRELTERLRSGDAEARRTFSRARLLGIFQDVCLGVAYAHSRGVVHRDLKPANVMIGEFGETLVVDWGLAKFGGAPADVATGRPAPSASDQDSSPLTLVGSVLGTPAFMAPEQAAGRLDEVDARSDIYSLGAILYVLLTWQLPWPAGSGDAARARRGGRVQRGERAAVLRADLRGGARGGEAASGGVALEAVSRCGGGRRREGDAGAPGGGGAIQRRASRRAAERRRDAEREDAGVSLPVSCGRADGVAGGTGRPRVSPVFGPGAGRDERSGRAAGAGAESTRASQGARGGLQTGGRARSGRLAVALRRDRAIADADDDAGRRPGCRGAGRRRLRGGFAFPPAGARNSSGKNAGRTAGASDGLVSPDRLARRFRPDPLHGDDPALLHEMQWEKAARGTDRRPFPFGRHLDERWCNIQRSQPDWMGPCAVEEFLSDESPYGVRGLGGNIRDACLNISEFERESDWDAPSAGRKTHGRQNWTSRPTPPPSPIFSQTLGGKALPESVRKIDRRRGRGEL
ncbi:MAG: serine/threonine protein kinase, partial [Planctomycetes bacterium]|nr:serine/threonine protein kinase [Planctomycetota bacterium]